MCSRKHIVFIFYFILCKLVASEITFQQDCTDVARDDETLLVFSTLGGGLTAIDPITSEIRWSIEDEPAIKVPTQTEFSMPQYLPDPRDGSLYSFGGVNGLKKLPYTIPQLVASAPCRSSDGILYSGKKSDTWFLIDPKTGRREKVLDFGGGENREKIGWATSRAVYLGRTQYTILMYDSLSKDKNSKPWNVTFFDYTSHSMAPELSKEYEWLHLSGSATGLTVTIDRRKGTIKWQKDFSSPVVAVFLLGTEGLLSVPFTTISDEALKNIIDDVRDGTKNDVKLFETLYVGEHLHHGLYALPSLVDKNTATIASDLPIRLLDGPHNIQVINDEQKLINLNLHLNNINHFESNNNDNKNIILLGYYQIPLLTDDLKLSLTQTMHKDFTSNNNKELATIMNFDIIKNLNNHNVEKNIIIETFPRDSDKVGHHSIGIQTDESNNILDSKNTSNFDEDDDDLIDGGKATEVKTKNGTLLVKLKYIGGWLYEREHSLVIYALSLLICILLYMFWNINSAVRELKQSQNSSQSVPQVTYNSNGPCCDLEILGNGLNKVGKIIFDPKDILGKGCEGTFVFRGTFETRQVAVKRLLPDNFTLADREVSLLRESDAHENVVRYFCTEQDRSFRYIAVELCAATLQDYTEGQNASDLRKSIDLLEVLRQATNGLIHLHSLNIVHRDIKPQNVLISLPDTHNVVKVMISDFGLCKKLNLGKHSFSRRSGITGTEGWIAPEMVMGQRTTTSVDIFSLGCVFYYVLSNGLHPFGDNVKRQGNILTNEYDLKYFDTYFNNENDSDDYDYERDNYTNVDVLAEELIKDMINIDPLRRPTALAIKNHPLFWRNEKILSFLQDVSDRVEKLDPSIEPLRTLEKNAKFIIKKDWSIYLDEKITIDLRKFRGYHGCSVRDLLRALRNKKHHYHELDTEVQEILGIIPQEFTNYWIKRFPRLLSHSYHALELCSKDNPFKNYYNNEYRFTKPKYIIKIINNDDENNNSFLSYNNYLKSSKKQTMLYSNTDQTNNNYNKRRLGKYNFHNKRKDNTNNNNSNLSINNNNNNNNNKNDEPIRRNSNNKFYKEKINNNNNNQQ